jgi:hypothetical protein
MGRIVMGPFGCGRYGVIIRRRLLHGPATAMMAEHGEGAGGEDIGGRRDGRIRGGWHLRQP